MRYKVFRILARGLSALGWNYKELISGYFIRLLQINHVKYTFK